MAITGIDTIEGKQIIAAGAVSAKSAEMAYNDENGNPITGYQVAGDYYSASNPSGFITGIDLTPYQLTADMTAYQSAGDYLTTADSGSFLTAVPDTYLQNTDLTIADNKVTEISGIPLAGGGGTTYTSPSGTIRIDGDTLEATNSAIISDTITDVVDNGGHYEDLSVSTLPNYPYNEYIVRRYSDSEQHVIDCVYGGVKVYSVYSSPFSVPLVSAGRQLTNIGTNGIISAIKDNSQVVELALKSDLVNYQTTAGMTAYQEAGDYYSASNPSGFITGVDLSDYATTASVAEKLDTTAFSTVSGDFLTAVDIPQSATWNEVSTTVQTNSAQWAESGTTYTSPSGTILINGDTLEGTNSAIVGGTITDVVEGGVNYINLTALPNYPYGEYLISGTAYWGTDTNCVYGDDDIIASVSIPRDETFSVPLVSAGYPLTYIQTYSILSAIKDNSQVVELALKSDLPTYQYDSSNKISAINGSAIAAGDEFPQSATEAIETVTSSSAIWNETSDTVSSNSGAWGGSALPISAGPGIKVNLVDNTLVFSNDETVLYTANAASNTIVLSEKATNFERLRLELQSYQSTMVVNYTEVKPNDNYLTFFAQTLIPAATYPLQILGVQFSSTNGITYNMSRGVRAYYKVTSDWGGNDNTDMTSNIKDAGYITKIIGINRIAGGN